MVSKKANISPLVLLSVVDHYKRYNAPRVVGILLGSFDSEKINISNSFAIPFEETENDFFIDTSYLNNMFELFYKVNCKEKIIGWYHSGPKMHNKDLQISNSFEKYCDEPILAIVDVKMETSGIPVQAYQLKHSKELVNINIQVSGDETEVVGVEHLLRDIKEGTGMSLKDEVNEILDSLKMYRNSLDEIIKFIENIEKGGDPNFTILEQLQNILNDAPKLVKSMDMSELYSVELTNTLISLNTLQANKAE